MIKAVIFDFYGVFVVDGSRILIERARKINESIAKELENVMKQHSYGLVDIDYVKDSFKIKLGLPDEEISDYFSSSKKLDERVIQFVGSLRAKSLKTGLLSNTGGDVITRYMVQGHVSSLFDALVLSYEVGLIKPNPEIYLMMAKRLGLQPADCLMIDDNQDNVDGALAAGMKAIKYTDFESMLQAIAHEMATKD